MQYNCNNSYLRIPAMNDINNYSSSAAADSGSPDTNRACLVVAVGSDGVEFAPSSSSSSSSCLTRCRKPRKKSSNLISIMEEEGVKGNKGGGYKKRDSEEAPKITRQCTQCGKEFSSWKALYGHMRCHPERTWRGINPPRNLIQPPPAREDTSDLAGLTLEDYEVATCLLLLANSGRETDPNEVKMVEEEHERFECSSCKKVFGSHQALGGHRASHKNVKGCFAITRTTTEGVDHHDHLLNVNLLSHADDGDENAAAVAAAGGGHKCSICLKVFSTGQALGGHKRCHWEKAETDESGIITDGSTLLPVDLNLPAPIDQDYHCSSSTLTLDLRLGL